MAASVVRDAAVTFGTQKQHLVFPGVRAQRPAMAEDNRLSFTPVLVVDLRSVFGRNRRFEDWLFLVGHKNSFSVCVDIGPYRLHSLGEVKRAVLQLNTCP